MKLILPLILAASIWAQPLSLATKDWKLTASGAPAATLYASSGLAFDFVAGTQADDRMVNYLTTTKVASSWPQTATVTATVQIVAAPGTVFWADDGASYVTPAARIFFAKRKYLNQYSRWWSNPSSIQLADGSFVLSVSLDPAKWTDANGQPGTANTVEFTKAIQAINEIGVTFGGEFFGHGAGITSGAAPFKIIRFEVQ